MQHHLNIQNKTMTLHYLNKFFGDVYYYIYFESDNQMHLLQDHDKLTSYINKSRQVVAVAHNKF